jgi:hypothetical protein
VRAGLFWRPQESGTFDAPVSLLKIGARTPPAPIGSCPDVKGMVLDHNAMDSEYLGMPVTQDGGGIISVFNGGNGNDYFQFDEPRPDEDGSVVLGGTHSTDGVVQLGVMIYDPATDRHSIISVTNTGTLYVYQGTGVTGLATRHSSSHTWVPSTSRLRIQITATDINYQLSTNSGASWVTKWTETRGAQFTVPRGYGVWSYFSAGAAVPNTITELLWSSA